MDEVKTIKEIKIVEDDPPKDNIKVEEKDPTTNDSLSADEDKTIKSLFEVEFSKPKVHHEKKLTKLIKQRLKLKQIRPKIVIGPIKGRKLRLNEKKFKFPPMETKVNVEKITCGKTNEETAEAVEEGDAKSVEIGTCKYCDACILLKDMKDHYLTHLDKEETDTKITKTEEDEKDKTTNIKMTKGKEPALQENSISSTKNIQDTGQNELDEDICKSSVMSKEEIEDKVKQKFDAYAKEAQDDKELSKDKDVSSEFIKRWGPILDIDDVSQYDEFDSTKSKMFFESMSNVKNKKNDSNPNHDQIENSDIVNVNIDKVSDQDFTSVNDLTTNEYGTPVENIENVIHRGKGFENIIDMKMEKNKADNFGNILKKTDMDMDDIKDTVKVRYVELLEDGEPVEDDELLDNGELLNIIKNPRSLTGQHLDPTKVMWSIGREIVSQNENIKKGAKLSLDECFHKFTDKIASADKNGRLTSRIQGPPHDLTERANRKNSKNCASEVGSCNKKTSILMNRIGAMDQDSVERSLPETVIKKEELSLSMDSSIGSKEAGLLPKEPILGIKTEYLNSEPMSEEYFEDLPYDPELDIKHEKDTNIGDLEENESSPASRLEKLINVKMEEAQLITKDMIGEVQMCSLPHRKRKHNDIHRNEKQRKINQLSEEVMKDNVGKIIIKSFPSDESLSDFQNNLAEDIVHTIKEEPLTELENDPNDPLSVIFVVWKDDSTIDMIEDANKDDLEKWIAPSVVCTTTKKIMIPRLKLSNSIPPTSPPVTYQPYTCHKNGPSIRLKKSMPSSEDSCPQVNGARYCLNTLADKTRQLKRRQCNSASQPTQGSKQSGQSDTKRKIGNLHLVKRRGVFTINREIASDSCMVQGRRSSNTQDYEGLKDGHNDSLKPLGDESMNSYIDGSVSVDSVFDELNSEGDIKTNQMETDDICTEASDLEPDKELLRKPKNVICKKGKGKCNYVINSITGKHSQNKAFEKYKIEVKGRSSKRPCTDPGTISIQLLPDRQDCDTCPACKERLSPLSLDWRVNVVSGTLEFTCSQCGQQVFVEGVWTGLMRCNYNKDINKIS